jgi:signal transduction histidine kinase
MAAHPVSPGANEPLSTGSSFLYEGRYARVARLVALAVICSAPFVGTPHASLRGHGLVILISLVVGISTQLIVVAFPSAPGSLVRTVVGAVAVGILVGYDPNVGTAVLLVFIGVDAGASLSTTSGGGVVSLAVVTTALAILASGEGTTNVTLGAVAVVGFLAAVGRRQYVLRAEEAELRLADAERAREERARAAGLAERANAAREIHDILAHSLGALVLQLDALGAVLGSESLDHERAVTILSRARALAVEGLSEARQAVGTLRSDPPPLIDTLGHLIESTGCGSFDVSGVPHPLPAEVSVALRRTAQEGLANAVKHAPGTTPSVHLAFAADEVTLTVTDTGSPGGLTPGPLAATGGGYGIEGLRERAELIGGTLVAGPYGEGWQVRLRVPVPDQDGAPPVRGGA